MSSKAVEKSKVQEMRDLMQKMIPQIKLAIPRHMTPERMARIAMSEFTKTPALAKCKPLSFVESIMQAAQLGLEPGILGQAYLIPYKDTCTFVPGWKGLVDLMSRTGRATVWTGAVFEGDEFHYSLGSSPFVDCKPSGEDDPNKITHFWACGKVNGAEVPVVEVWTAAKMLKHLNRFNKIGDGHYAYKHWEMYGRKIVLLQVLKYMPMSIEEAAGRALATGIAVANAESSGEIIDVAVAGFQMADDKADDKVEVEILDGGGR